MDTKTCSCCKREFPRNNYYFYYCKSYKDGLHYRCRECQGGKFVREGYRTCTKCHSELPETSEYFPNEKLGKHGFSSRCKKCKKKYYQDNEDKIKAWNKTYLEERKDEVREYNKKYHIANREKAIAKVKAWNIENKEKVRARRKEYLKRIDVKERRNQHKQLRRAKKRSLPHDFTSEQWRVCQSYFSNKCAYCGNKRKLEQDHFIPLSKNGEYNINNILPACKNCNSGKRDQDFFVWYSKQEFYSSKREDKILQYLNYSKNGTQQLALTI